MLPPEALAGVRGLDVADESGERVADDTAAAADERE